MQNKMRTITSTIQNNLNGDDEPLLVSYRSESTAKGMFSWSGLHVDSCGCALYITARNTAETVGMYAVLFRPRSHVSAISWQSRLNIFFALSLSLSFLLFPFICIKKNQTYEKKIHWLHLMLWPYIGEAHGSVIFAGQPQIN